MALLNDLTTDAVRGGRSLARIPAFAVACVGTLALGVSATLPASSSSGEALKDGDGGKASESR
jgi:hypothetical protein